MRVLGVDPGYDRVGFAVIEKVAEQEQLVFSECFETNRGNTFEARLHALGAECERLITTYRPDAAAFEKLFFQNNQKTAFLVSEARGAMRYIAAAYMVPIFEYAPHQIKNAVAGDGRGNKQQIMNMVHQLISIDKKIQYDDEYDAIAVGLTCLASERL